MTGAQPLAGSYHGKPAIPADQREPSSEPFRRYRRDQAVVFLKTREAFGGLSNMAAGFPLRVNGTEIRTSEALYQACRFPHLPDIQREILEQRSPMTAKMKGKPHRADSRPDWNHVRINVMRWCLRVKLVQHWDTFAGLLESTGDGPIVEESRRDAFWGAKPEGDHVLVGMNILGRLLMELRKMAREGGREAFRVLPPPELENFRLLGEPVEAVQGDTGSPEDAASPPHVSRSASDAPALVPRSDTVRANRDAELIAHLQSLVRDHPVSRREINAAVTPLLPENLPEKEKNRRIGNHLRRLQRAGWIAFHQPDRQWRAGGRRALPDLRDLRVKRDRTARRT